MLDNLQTIVMLPS